MKKLLAAILAISMLTTTAYASFTEDVKNSSLIFSEKFTAPTWLFKDCRETPDSIVFLQSDKYNVSFYSKDINAQLTDKDRYDLSLKRNENYKLDAEYDNWVGSKTPKMAFNFANGEKLPGVAHITLNDSNFAPYSTLYVYHRVDENKYELVAKDILVATDRSFTFPTSTTGQLLISSIDIQDKVVPYSYTVPTLGEVLSGKTFPDTGVK